MNRAKWENCHSTPRLVIKLAEETGEVAKAHLDMVEAKDAEVFMWAEDNLREEIDHVLFIAGRLKELHDG